VSSNSNIRQATHEDAQAISALNAEVQRVHSDALPNLFKPPAANAFAASQVHQLLANPKSFMFIAFKADTPVGYVYAHLIEGPETDSRHAWNRIHIHHLSVDRTSQGEGIGRDLVHAVVGVAKERGIATVTLGVWSVNETARSFFVAQGFSAYQEDMWLNLGE
jgi:ribosomal protein S18 acetylase RimI-like enzyme